MKGGKKYKKTGCGRIKTAGDFSVIVDPCFWKLLNNDDDVINYVYCNKLQKFAYQKLRKTLLRSSNYYLVDRGLCKAYILERFL